MIKNQVIAEAKKSQFDSLVPATALIEENVLIGSNVILGNIGVLIRSQARLDTACVIADNVTVGQGAWVRAGAVVLQTVPAFAIVEGNPARVVGYVNHPVDSVQPEPRLIDAASMGEVLRPCKIKTDVGESAVYLMRKITDARGSLSVGEVPDELPFVPVRYFIVYDVPSLELRGEHAHKRCEQFLICLHGSCHEIGRASCRERV